MISSYYPPELQAKLLQLQLEIEQLLQLLIQLKNQKTEAGRSVEDAA